MWYRPSAGLPGSTSGGTAAIWPADVAKPDPRVSPLELVKLTPLMKRTQGKSELLVGLIDGPVDARHPHLASENICEAPGRVGVCGRASSAACAHGTFVAGILAARRGSPAPAICPGCTLLVRPIFAETSSEQGRMPTATPYELAGAIVDCIEAGACVLNVSAALVRDSLSSDRALEEALEEARRKGVLVVAAAGNQASVGSTAITRHPWVIPVVAYSLQGRLMSLSNLGASIGKRGLGAPGEGVVSLTPGNAATASGGTSIAAPFVTGAIALLWSQFPSATAARVRLSLLPAAVPRRAGVVPPLLDAWSSYWRMVQSQGPTSG